MDVSQMHALGWAEVMGSHSIVQISVRLVFHGVWSGGARIQWCMVVCNGV